MLLSLDLHATSHAETERENSDAQTTFNPTHYEGKVLYAIFWASWCLTCKETLHWATALQNRHQEEGLQVVIISLDNVPGQAEALLKKESISLPLFHDHYRQLSAKYRLFGMPSAIVFDRSGAMRYRHGTINQARHPSFEKDIVKMLRTP